MEKVNSKSKTSELARPQRPASGQLKSLTNPSEASDGSRSKAGAKSESTTRETSSKVDPRTKDPRVPRDTGQFAPNNVPPANFKHGPPAQEYNTSQTSAPVSPPALSSILQGFLGPDLRAYKKCEQYCKQNPAIWIEDPSVLRELTIKHLSEQTSAQARLHAERYLMITNARNLKLTATQANDTLRALIKNDREFQEALDRFLETLIPEVSNTEDDESVPPIISTKPQVEADRPRFPLIPGSVLIKTADARVLHSPAGVPLPQDPNQRSLPSRRRSAGQDAMSPKIGNGAPSLNNDQSLEQRDGDASVNLPSLGSVQRKKIGRIDANTPSLGPDPTRIDKSFVRENRLDAAYRVRTGPEAVKFFVKGRVLAVVWHENAGASIQPDTMRKREPLDKPFHTFTLTQDGIPIFSHIRRFVIVKAKRNYCVVIPISSYGGRGLVDKNMPMQEKQAHTIVYAHDGKARRMVDEVRLDKSALAVILADDEQLTASSRLHCGKMQVIEWNVRVKDVGMIKDDDIPKLINYFNKELHSNQW